MARMAAPYASMWGGIERREDMSGATFTEPSFMDDFNVYSFHGLYVRRVKVFNSEPWKIWLMFSDYLELYRLWENF